MGWINAAKLEMEKESESNQPLTSSPSPSSSARHSHDPPPKDDYNIGYTIFFILGAGFLLPWNCFITAVDYFQMLYPNSHTDRVFSIAYMIPCLVFLLGLTFCGQHCSLSPRSRINAGISTFLVIFVLMFVMDEVWITGDKGTKTTHSLTVAASTVLGVADALVQASLIGSVAELPERYMQALVAGTAASGLLASMLRVITKAALPQTITGLRLSADVYFAVTGVILLICLFCYNLVYKLPIMVHYNNLKIEAMQSKGEEHHHDMSELGLKQDVAEIALITTSGSSLTNFAKPQSYRHVWNHIRSLALSLGIVYMVTMAIFPGYITEDVHSAVLGDWYPILLIAIYNVGDLVGKILTSVYMMEDQVLMIWGCFGRLIFFPLFYVVLHGPACFRTEGPVFVLTLLLGLSNGYLTSNVMIVAPKNVSIVESETAGIIMTLFLVAGLTCGSLLGWVWII